MEGLRGGRAGRQAPSPAPSAGMELSSARHDSMFRSLESGFGLPIPPPGSTSEQVSVPLFLTGGNCSKVQDWATWASDLAVQAKQKWTKK